MVPATTPPKMDEEMPSTSTQAANANNGAKTKPPKRQRLEDNTSPPTDIDISGLNYDPNNQNRFSMFADLEIESVHHSNIAGKKPENSGTGAAETRETANSFCPPIFLHNINIKQLVDQLNVKIPKITFKIKNVSKNKCKLYLADPLAHSAMLQTLREKSVHAFSFTPKELKQVSFILRGLYNGIEIESVKRALEERIPDVIAKVVRYTTPRSIKLNVETGLLLVTLLPGKSLSDISHLKDLLNQTISWEKPKKKETEIQCHRCQRWGHVSKNCGSQYNCVKCNQKHLPGECQRQKTDSSSPYCVNCDEEGHTANWRGCPTFKKYVAKRKERIQKAIEEKEAAKINVRRTINASLVSPGKSFANLFNSESQQNKKPSIINDFLKLANLFLQPEELSLEQEINIFLEEFQNMPKKEAKEEFLRLLKKVKSTYGP